MSGAASLPSSRFHNYLGAVGASSMAMGLQNVLFPWIVVGILGEDPHRLGLAQMAVMLPNLLFILIGGAFSDSRHLGTHLGRLYLVYGFPIGMLLAMAVSGLLVYWHVLLYAVLYGLTTAFVQPARESLLPQLTGQALQQAVAKSALIQFGAQSLGIAAAGQLDRVGLPVLLGFQLALFAGAAILIRRCQPKGEGIVTERKPVRLAGVLEGVGTVFRHKRLLPLMSLVAATGFLGIGAYFVAMPVLAREVYNQDAGFFAIMQLCFVAGILCANVIFIRWVKSLRHPGRLMLISLFLRGLLIALAAFQLPLWLLFPLLVLWGMMSGVSTTLGRAMTHEEAPPEMRSRVVSVYQLCLFGGAPIGAWATGYAIDHFGLMPSLVALGVLTTLVTLANMAFSGLWQQRREMQSAPQ